MIGLLGQHRELYDRISLKGEECMQRLTAMVEREGMVYASGAVGSKLSPRGRRGGVDFCHHRRLARNVPAKCKPPRPDLGLGTAKCDGIRCSRWQKRRSRRSWFDMLTEASKREMVVL